METQLTIDMRSDVDRNSFSFAWTRRRRRCFSPFKVMIREQCSARKGLEQPCFHQCDVVTVERRVPVEKFFAHVRHEYWIMLQLIPRDGTETGRCQMIDVCEKRSMVLEIRQRMPLPREEIDQSLLDEERQSEMTGQARMARLLYLRGLRQEWTHFRESPVDFHLSVENTEELNPTNQRQLDCNGEEHGEDSCCTNEEPKRRIRTSISFWTRFSEPSDATELDFTGRWRFITMHDDLSALTR